MHDYKKEMHRRKLTAKLKNAILVVWLDVKKERSKANLEDIIKNLTAKSSTAKGDKNGQTTEELKQLRKQKRENERKEAQEKAQEE